MEEIYSDITIDSQNMNKTPRACARLTCQIALIRAAFSREAVRENLLEQSGIVNLCDVRMTPTAYVSALPD